MTQSRILGYVKVLFTTIFAFVFGFPFLWMIFGMFKTNNEIFHTPDKILPNEFNLVELWGKIQNLQIYPYMANSFYVAIIGTVVLLIISTLFSYAIVFFENKFTKVLFAIVMLTYMLPSSVTYIPSFKILVMAGLGDSLAGLVFSCLTSVFTVFYLRQNMKKISMDYIEAAKIDGAGHFSIIKNIVIPMTKSAYFSCGLLYFIYMYNNYMWPTIILKSDKNFLISQGLRRFFITEGAYGMNWSEIMTANALTVFPVIVVLIIAHKHFITGIAGDSGIK